VQDRVEHAGSIVLDFGKAGHGVSGCEEFLFGVDLLGGGLVMGVLGGGEAWVRGGYFLLIAYLDDDGFGGL
jgi:hypothetical protein